MFDEYELMGSQMKRRGIENAGLASAVVKTHFEHIRDVLQGILDDDMKRSTQEVRDGSHRTKWSTKSL